MENDKPPGEDEKFLRIKRAKKKLTIVTGIMLGVMFILDIVLFAVGMIEWYMFVPVAVLYCGVFPFAVIMLTKLKPIVYYAPPEEEKSESSPLSEYDE